MPVTPGNYQRRILNGSGLDPEARFVAVVLSRLANSNADEFGWFAAPDSRLAEETAYNRKTVANRIDVLERDGWLEVQPVVAGNRYQSTRYRLALPVKERAPKPAPKRQRANYFTTDNQPARGPSGGHLEPPPRGPSGGHLEPSSRCPPGGQELSAGWTTKYVSTSKVVGDGAASSGVVGNDEKEPQPPPEPPAPQAVAPDGEQTVWDSIDAERLDEELADLAAAVAYIHPAMAVACPHCGAAPNQRCGQRIRNGWQPLTRRRFHPSREESAKGAA